MKKTLVLILMALVVNVVAFAQTYQEVVYLKNGSVIRGVIVEQIPSVSLKIQTADGSIFAYQMDKVEKITKELPLNPTKTKTRTTYADNGYKLKKGYRGFVDFGFSYGVGSWGQDRIEFSTTHGYQILPCLFAGLGIGFHYYHWDGVLEIPIYADIRGTLPCRSICQPFLDFKIGYTVYDADGFYMTPSIGCRFAVSRTCGISVGIGYAMQKAEVVWSSYHWPHTRENVGAVTFKVGVDF